MKNNKKENKKTCWIGLPIPSLNPFVETKKNDSQLKKDLPFLGYKSMILHIDEIVNIPIEIIKLKFSNDPFIKKRHELFQQMEKEFKKLLKPVKEKLLNDFLRKYLEDKIEK